VALQNYVTYLSVLLNEDIDANRKSAEQLFAQKPEDLGFLTTMALVRLRDNQPAAAYALFSSNTFNFSTFPASCKAVYATALGLSNRGEEARNVVQTIKFEELRTEEVALIKPWIVPKP
jgi:predicted Zn-dependent protease